MGIEAERGDIYVVDVQRRTLRRLTRTGSPTWTLDGQRVTFASRRPQISAEEKWRGVVGVAVAIAVIGPGGRETGQQRTGLAPDEEGLE